jgi:hypothetical protein
LAYGTRRYGVNVAGGDLDGDGYDEIITGPGPGPALAAHVRGWDYDGSHIALLPGANFFAYTGKFGAVVASGDADGDPRKEILTMPGPGPSNTAHARGWNVDEGDLTLVEPVNFRAYDKWMKYGGNLSGGNLSE